MTRLKTCSHCSFGLLFCDIWFVAMQKTVFRILVSCLLNCGKRCSACDFCAVFMLFGRYCAAAFPELSANSLIF